MSKRKYKQSLISSMSKNQESNQPNTLTLGKSADQFQTYRVPCTTLLAIRKLKSGLYSGQIKEFSLVLVFIAIIQYFSLSCNNSQITVFITLGYKQNTTKQPSMRRPRKSSKCTHTVVCLREHDSRK